MGEARLRRGAGSLPGNCRGHGGRGPGRAAALPAIARRLSHAGCYRWRREEFDIRAKPDGPVLARLDRGALPSFGVMALGVHVNGLVRRADGLHVWVAPPGRGQAGGAGPSSTTWWPAACRPGSRRGDAGEGGRRGGRHPGRTGRPGGAGRDPHLRHGTAGGAAPRHPALLRPGIARGFHPPPRRRRGGDASNSGPSPACCRRCATRTR